MNSLKRLHIRIVAALLAVVLIISYLGFTLLRPLPAASITQTAFSPASLEPLQPFAWPAHGEAAVAMEGNDTLFTSGPQQPLPIASVAKIMTALTVLQAHPLAPGQQGPQITMTDVDVAAYQRYKAQGGSVVMVTAGETLSEYQALQALLLPSANNIAETLATWAFGSLAAYTTTANQLAHNLGMTQSVFTDPSGFSPTTLGTASDVIRLGKAALQNPVIAEIVQQKSAPLPLVGEVRNVNWLLGQDGISGIKTGNSDQAGGCYLFVATHQVGNKPVKIVGAIVGDTDLQAALNDTTPLLKSTRDNIIAAPIVRKGQTVGIAHTKWGTAAPAIITKDFTALQWKGTKITTRTTFTSKITTVSPGTAIGILSIQAGNTPPQTTPVTLQTPLTAPSWKWRVLHPFN